MASAAWMVTRQGINAKEPLPVCVGVLCRGRRRFLELRGSVIERAKAPMIVVGKNPTRCHP